MSNPSLEAGLRAAARLAGQAPALLDATGVRATHDDLRRIRDGGRLRLRQAGIGRQDRVALIMTDGWETAAGLLAASSACAVAALDPGLTDRELTVCLQRLTPKAVLADPNAAARMRSLVGEEIRVLEWSADGLDGPPDDEQPAPADIALLLLTSGTTAAPKVVRLSQRNLAAAAASIAGTLRLDGRDRALNMMPMYHGHGMFPGTFAPLIAGGSTVCTRPDSAQALLAVVESAAPTWYSAAPIVHHTVLAMARGNPDIASALRLRAVRSTSSALAPRLLAQLEQVLSAPVVEAYALSEGPGQIASNPLAGPRKAGTVGVPQNTEIVLLTASGELTAEPGSTGEVLVRGPNVMPGYLDVPPEHQPFLDGWLRTGDHATFDEDGYLTIGGRTVDVISRGAEKFSPTEVEAVLAEHPEVRDTAAFGRPHPTLGQESAAAVVVREGATVTEADLITFAADRLSAYKVPVRILFLPDIPRGDTGKILRRRLTELTARPSARAARRTAPSR